MDFYLLDNINERLFEWINIGLSNKFFDIFLSNITKLGSIVFAFLFTLAICILSKNVRLTFKIVYVLAFNLIVVQILKYIFNTVRPFCVENANSNLIYSDAFVRTLGPGFPSSHSAVIFTIAFIMHRLYPRLSPLYFSIAIIVSFSRIYLGVHYPFDVLFGSLFGLISGWLFDKRFKLKDEIANRNSTRVL
ncbi:MAG: hypothetical protein DRH57_01095 [Candidatus Cloacimonadota bacterium]|nr:MAG: hypothetical protein DRH57_01095 [Candidatus Cloacimonadota bacterium]